MFDDRNLNASPSGPRALGLTALVLACLGSVALVPAAVAGPPRTLASAPEVEVQAPAREVSTAGFENAARTDDGRIQVIVELEDPAAAVVFAQAMQGSLPSDKRALQVAGAASKAQVLRNQAAQESVAKELTAPSIGAREIYRVTKALNGIAVAVDPRNLRSLLKIKGVKRLLPILMEYPTNSTSVPFIGAPGVWANTIGLPAGGADGTGVRVGIIDTGIDYLHGDFGGTGVLADYQTESTATANFTTAGSFPTAKVVGGTDLVGDAYTGNNVPVPDANPMDCNGHGSHVAGTAAGFGVDGSGNTYTGPYSPAAPFGSLRIGPGVAPKALLYAIRVFGCTGGTGVVVQALDWAMDPNQDNDLSDHLDVVNMSLGSDFGSAINSTSVAADNASLAGVIVAMSAGNASDTFFIAGAPGVATRGIATAASVDSEPFFESVQVNSPGSIAGSYLGGSMAFGPAPSGQTADMVIAVDATTPAACGPDPNDACCALTNAAAVSGKICVANRGTCSFKTKTLNCQNAGAIGVVIVNNAPGSPPPGGADDPTIVTPITIPTEMITLADGTTIKNTIIATPPVNATLLGQSGADTLASFSSRGPRRIFGSPLRLKPDVAAPGLNISSVQTGHTCMVAAGCTGVSDPSGFQAGNKALIISGTSMASPHIAGTMALLRQLHPDWSVEELKALVMNYAIHDTTLFPNATPPRFGPSRIGGGRVDPAKAALGDVVAMNADDVGLVSVTFEPEVVGTVTQTKKIRLVNKGTVDETYDLAFDNIVNSPGVTFSVMEGSTVMVPAGQTVELHVQMSANSALMDHTKDPALFSTQGVQVNFGDQPRNFLAEHEAYLTFSQSSTLKFRLPVYMAEKPSSMMSAPDTIVTGGAPTGSTTIPLSGMDLCTGTLAAGPTCTGSFPNDVESLVSPFELQVVSPLDPVNSNDYADIHYAGISYLQTGGSLSLTNDLVMFGVASWGDWSTPTDVAYAICVDNNNDGVYDRAIINTDPSIFVANASHNDNFVRVVENLATAGFTILGLGSPVNLVQPSVVDTALHLNNVMILAATPSALGYISTATTTIRYKVVTCPGSNPGCARSTTGDHCTPAPGTFFDIATGPGPAGSFFWNWAAQGLNFGGDFLDEDLNGNSLPVTWNTANMTANGSLGALLLHHQNGSGKRAEVVVLDTAQRADLAVTKSVDNPTPAVGANVIFTITVTNNGPNNATGVVVNDFLPDGTTYVSDDGAGAYNSGTGLWTIPGTINNGSSVTLHITASVDLSGQICNQAQITAGSPLDTIPDNNQATSCINAPRTADLAITVSGGPPTVNPGGLLTYTITVTNNGDDPAYNLITTTTFSSTSSFGTLVYSGVTPGVVFTTGTPTSTWNLGSLDVGASKTLQFSIAAPNIAANLNLSVSTVSTKALRITTTKAFDPNLGNNASSAVVKVLSPATVSATKTVSGSFIEGGTVTYTIVLSNSGPFDQQNNTGPELTDVLPSQLTLVNATAPSGSFSNSGNTVNWNGVIPAGGSVTITITATINAGTALQTVSNQATVHYDANGDFVDNNEATALSDNPSVGGANDPTTFVVISPASIGTHTKTVSGTFSEGGTVTYTVTISNPSGNAQLDNPGDEFTDVLPASLTLVSASAGSGTAVADVPNNTVHWNGSIAAGGSVTITFTALVNNSTAGTTICNQGTIFFDADGNGTNESSILTDDPGVGGVNDPTCFAVVAIAQVPTLSTVGLTLMALLLLVGALLVLRRRLA
ncbi:MAG: S8 family serine peptidase [Thermoanaerobaculia bacterium]